MRIDNADGGEVEACGNATRCVGWLLMRESGRDSAAILTQAGLLNARPGWRVRGSRTTLRAPRFVNRRHQMSSLPGLPRQPIP